MNIPLVSVYVPCFNNVKTIKRCIDSLVCQTYANIEILVIDNMSTDNSRDVVKELIKADNRIRLISCETRGLSAVRNTATPNAKGEWITTVDGDDSVEPEYVERLITVAKSRNADVVCCSHYYINVKKQRIKLSNFTGASKEDVHCFFLTKGRRFCQVWGKLYKKELLEKITYPEGRIFEDIAALPHVIEEAGKVIIIDEPLYDYYENSQSISHKSKPENMMDGLEARLDNCSFYREKYHVLYPDAYDCVLDFGFFLLGRIYRAGRENYDALYGEVVGIIKDALIMAGVDGFKMRRAVKIFLRNPEKAGKYFNAYSKRRIRGF